MPRWRIEQFRGRRVEHLGTVEAPDEQSASAEAAKRFEIPAALRFKLVATKVDVAERKR